MTFSDVHSQKNNPSFPLQETTGKCTLPKWKYKPRDRHNIGNRSYKWERGEWIFRIVNRHPKVLAGNRPDWSNMRVDRYTAGC